jgi:uncharacterized protein YoxC
MKISTQWARWTLLLALLAVAGRWVRAEEVPTLSDLSSCLDEIKKVCAGLEDQLEKCLAERAKELTVKCHDLLKSAISVAQSNTGAGACVADVKQSCGGLAGEALSDCILKNKSGFSKACREVLESTDKSEAQPYPKP